MKKMFYCFLLLTTFLFLHQRPVQAQKNITLLVNVVETLQFLKDIKANKVSLERTAGEIKAGYSNNDSIQTLFRQKYSLVKIAADNILNSIIIDLMDKDKRTLFIERPSIINDYYNEQVTIYNQTVKDFNSSYAKLKNEKGLLDFIKQAAKLLLGELMAVTKKIAMEMLIEKIRAPYQMKDWKDI